MSDTNDSTPRDETPGGKTPALPPRRRWPRRVAIGVAVTGVLLGGAVWLLGRESTLQALVRKAASASGGEITATGVSGSLYGSMHVGHLVFRSKTSLIVADNIDIRWSPLQYFSDGIVINALHIASLSSQSLGPSTPATMPASLAPPFRLSVDDARLDKLTLVASPVAAAGEKPAADTVIGAIHLALSGDQSGWKVRDGSAATPVGAVTLAGTIAGRRPFAINAKAALTQSAPPAGHAPAQLALQAGGDLALLQLTAKATSENAGGDAALTLAPFEPIILRALKLQARDIDPSRFNPVWPKAKLSLDASAAIAANQGVSGRVVLNNQGEVGAIDRQLLPLKSITAQLNGSLTDTRIEQVVIDLAGAGKLAGGGDVKRDGPTAGVASANFALHTDRIDLKAIQGSMKATHIAGDVRLADVTAADGRATQSFAVQLAEDGLRLDVKATLADALLKIAQGHLEAGSGKARAAIDVGGQLALGDGQPFKATVSANHFNPAAFGAFPAADLNADIHASGHVTPAWQVAADFALRPSRLFDQPLSGSGKLNADAGKDGPHVAGVVTSLALGKNTIEARGAFGAPGEQLSWKVDAPQLSALRPDLQGAVSASGIASGGVMSPRSSFTVDAKGMGLAAANRTKTAPADSLLHASGEFSLAGAQHAPTVTIAGSAARVNPAAFGNLPSGSINADFKASASMEKSAWQAAMDLQLQPSTLSNAPLSGHAVFTATPRRVANADVDLHLGPNALTARGGYGAPRDRLDWKLDAPQLSSAGPQFGGVLRGAGSVVTGAAIDNPDFTAAITGSDLRLFGQTTIKAFKLNAALSAGTLASDVDVSNLASGTFILASAHVKAGGTEAAHTVQLAARNDDFDANLAMKGGWDGKAWSGSVDTLQNRGRYALALQAPMAVRVAGPAGSGLAGLAHPQTIAVGAANIKLADGSINLASLTKDGPRWHSTGQASAVPVNYLAQAVPAWRDNTRSDLTLGATWALDLQAAGAGEGEPQLAGNLHVYREKGDISVGVDQPLALGLRTLDAKLDVAGDNLKIALDVDGARAGQVKVAGGTTLRRGRIADDSPLTLTASANMASLAWLGPLTGQAGLELGGGLKVAVSGAGTIAAPSLNGSVNGEKLVVNWADQGVKLHNGQLQAQLAGDQLQLQRLSFDGEKGNVQADGWIRFANAQPTMQLKVVANQLQALSRPDRTLVLSGQSTLVRDLKHFQLDGSFKADRALIELPSQSTPTLSSDVVVLGKNGSGAGVDARAPAPSMPLNIALAADLGNDFTLRGKGLDAQLGGSVQINVQDRRPPRIIGSIRVASGTYAAYGQKLSIERGLLNFTGAYDNPGLNILAVRKRPEGETLTDTNVEAGVEVRGTALAPTARLVSTPDEPDSEKLAWLVLGHGTAGTGSDEMGLLTTAAGALFGGSGNGGGLQSRVANSLGLDEVGLGQSSAAGTSTTNANGTQAKGLESTVVTVGKRLSQRAYLSFEQGTSTASSLVKLRYKLNSRITLQLLTGVNSGFDLLYGWAFD
jgi:translocation and assembly module TamB